MADLLPLGVERPEVAVGGVGVDQQVGARHGVDEDPGLREGAEREAEVRDLDLGPSQMVRWMLAKPSSAFSMWECIIQSISGPA